MKEVTGKRADTSAPAARPPPLVRTAHAAPVRTGRGGPTAETDTIPPRYPPAARRAAVVAAALALLVLKLAYVFPLEVNSDEPQHLHILWGWTSGLLPYRDLFDNHTPLFALLWSPWLALFGARADIVPLMRLTVLPLYGAALWLTWGIAEALWSRRVAAAAVAITAVCGPFFIVSTQVRPDDLWVVLWLATVRVTIGCAPDARRGLAAGLLAGAAFAASLKTLPLLFTAGIAALLLGFAQRRLLRARSLWPFAASLAAGFVVLPGMFAVFFAANGAGPAMLYDLFRHNMVSDLGRWQHGEALRFLLAPVTLPIALLVALRFRSRDGDTAQWLRRSFVFLAASGYLVTLYAYWPLFTRQDLLPSIPFVAIAIAAWLLHEGSRQRPLRRARETCVWLLVLAELVLLVVSYPFWTDRQADFQHLLGKVLALARPDDLVLDAKGDSIFRRRPIYWVLEGVTLTRMREGSIADDIPARLARTGTPVVLPDRLPPRDLDFVASNYLAVDTDLRVAGRRLGSASAGKPLRFELAVPQDYAVVQRSGVIDATIDGTPCRPACRLAPGKHALVVDRPGDVALVWAPALARGVVAPSLFAAAGRGPAGGASAAGGP